MEMLIVVAIIAILIAIAIPIFNTQLEKARIATDNANIRSAKSLAVATYLTDDYTLTGEGAAAKATLYFDAANGTLGTAAPGTGYGKSSVVKDDYITVVITASAVSVYWKDATPPTAVGTVNQTGSELILSYYISYAG